MPKRVRYGDGETTWRAISRLQLHGTADAALTTSNGIKTAAWPEDRRKRQALSAMAYSVAAAARETPRHGLRQRWRRRRGGAHVGGCGADACMALTSANAAAALRTRPARQHRFVAANAAAARVNAACVRGGARRAGGARCESRHVSLRVAQHHSIGSAGASWRQRRRWPAAA